VARAAKFAQKVVILDEPTVALGPRDPAEVLRLIARLRQGGRAKAGKPSPDRLDDRCSRMAVPDQISRGPTIQHIRAE
jgi:alpha-D-ribose 1-methylphosphonate 5-triphosphate synthase subunit PhnL